MIAGILLYSADISDLSHAYMFLVIHGTLNTGKFKLNLPDGTCLLFYLPHQLLQRPAADI